MAKRSGRPDWHARKLRKGKTDLFLARQRERTAHDIQAFERAATIIQEDIHRVMHRKG